MAITVSPVEGSFAARIGKVDLTRPLSAAEFDQVLEVFHHYPVLVFPDQDIDDEAQVEFSSRFGPIETSVRYGTAAAKAGGEADWPTESESVCFLNLTNVEENGDLFDLDDWRSDYHAANLEWHTDSSYKATPADATLMSGRVVPPAGADTEFADMRAAYDALSDEMKKRLDGLVVEHSIVYSRSLTSGDVFTEEEKAALPPSHHVLVRTHPVSGCKTLFMGTHASHIVGWPIEEGRTLLKELVEHATQPHLVHCHKWRQMDLLMWDNRSVLHRATPWEADKYPRLIRRTSVAGTGCVF